MKIDPHPTRHLDWHILIAFVAVTITLLSGLVAALVYSRYEPLLLNGQGWPFVATVVMQFTLNRANG